MCKIKTLFFLLILFIIANNKSVYAQIGGISASKLATLNSATVGHKTIEFEPAFGSSWSNSYFDADGKSQGYFPNNDRITNESELGFRFSYGASEGLEIGMAVPFSADAVSFGSKYNFLEKNKLSVSALLGYNKILNATLPTGNRVYEESDLIVGGFALTYAFDDAFSIDFDYQAQKAKGKTLDKHKLDNFINLDIGYYVFEWLQPVVGFNHGSNAFDNDLLNASSTDLNLGFTIEPANNFLMVINTPITLAGKNTDKVVGFGFALTITLD